MSLDRFKHLSKKDKEEFAKAFDNIKSYAKSYNLQFSGIPVEEFTKDELVVICKAMDKVLSSVLRQQIEVIKMFISDPDDGRVH